MHLLKARRDPHPDLITCVLPPTLQGLVEVFPPRQHCGHITFEFTLLHVRLKHESTQGDTTGSKRGVPEIELSNPRASVELSSHDKTKSVDTFIYG